MLEIQIDVDREAENLVIGALCHDILAWVDGLVEDLDCRSGGNNKEINSWRTGPPCSHRPKIDT